MTDDFERGAMTATVDYIRKDISEIKADVNKLRISVSDLDGWRNRVVGIAAIVSAVIGLTASYLINALSI